MTPCVVSWSSVWFPGTGEGLVPRSTTSLISALPSRETLASCQKGEANYYLLLLSGTSMIWEVWSVGFFQIGGKSGDSSVGESYIWTTSHGARSSRDLPGRAEHPKIELKYFSILNENAVFFCCRPATESSRTPGNNTPHSSPLGPNPSSSAPNLPTSATDSEDSPSHPLPAPASTPQLPSPSEGDEPPPPPPPRPERPSRQSLSVSNLNDSRPPTASNGRRDARRRSTRHRNYLNRSQLHQAVELPDGYGMDSFCSLVMSWL